MPKPSSTLASLPAAYQAWRASELGRITDRIEEGLVLELVGSVSGQRVLDVGCGDGVLCIRLAEAGGIVTGLDTDPRMLAAARERARTSQAAANFVEGDARSLPFADSSVDVVVAVTVLCFVADAERAVKEMARVLRPGGRLVLGELGRDSLWAARRRLSGWLGSRTWRNAHFRTAGELRVSHWPPTSRTPMFVARSITRRAIYARDGSPRSIPIWLGLPPSAQRSSQLLLVSPPELIKRAE